MLFYSSLHDLLAKLHRIVILLQQDETLGTYHQCNILLTDILAFQNTILRLKALLRSSDLRSSAQESRLYRQLSHDTDSQLTIQNIRSMIITLTRMFNSRLQRLIGHDSSHTNLLSSCLFIPLCSLPLKYSLAIMQFKMLIETNPSYNIFRQCSIQLVGSQVALALLYTLTSDPAEQALLSNKISISDCDLRITSDVPINALYITLFENMIVDLATKLNASSQFVAKVIDSSTQFCTLKINDIDFVYTNHRSNPISNVDLTLDIFNFRLTLSPYSPFSFLAKKILDIARVPYLRTIIQDPRQTTFFSYLLKSILKSLILGFKLKKEDECFFETLVNNSHVIAKFHEKYHINILEVPEFYPEKFPLRATLIAKQLREIFSLSEMEESSRLFIHHLEQKDLGTILDPAHQEYKLLCAEASSRVFIYSEMNANFKFIHLVKNNIQRLIFIQEIYEHQQKIKTLLGNNSLLMMINFHEELSRQDLILFQDKEVSQLHFLFLIFLMQHQEYRQRNALLAQQENQFQIIERQFVSEPQLALFKIEREKRRSTRTKEAKLFQKILKSSIPPLLTDIDAITSYLINAVLTNDLESIMQYRSYITDIHTDRYAMYHSTPLYTAIETNNLAAAEILLTLGARAHSFNPSGYSTVYIAVLLETSDMLRLLLKFNAEPDRPEIISKNTPLLAAISSEKCEAVELLVKAGANPVLPSIENKMPLDIALKSYDINPSDNTLHIIRWVLARFFITHIKFKPFEIKQISDVAKNRHLLMPLVKQQDSEVDRYQRILLSDPKIRALRQHPLIQVPHKRKCR